MKYYVRAPGDSKMHGPYLLSDIREQISKGELRSDFEAHLAEGQSYGALKRSAAWMPLTTVYQLERGVGVGAQEAVLPQVLAVSRSIRKTEKSGVATALSAVAVLELVASPIAGIMLASQQAGYLGWMVFVSGVVSGLILLGFATVIDHLFEFVQRLREIEYLARKIADQPRA